MRWPSRCLKRSYYLHPGSSAEDTRIQSGSVEDGPVGARLVASALAAQGGEEEKASGKSEASKAQARGAGSIPLLLKWSNTSIQ